MVTGYRQESVEIESSPSTPCVEDAEVSQDASGSMSLPYWVEASHNIYKVHFYTIQQTLFENSIYRVKGNEP